MKKISLLLAFFSANVFATSVNVNTADAKTISTALAGIGLKKAEAIVADRTKNGPFTSIDNLKRVSGIGEKTISANRDDILLSDPKAAAPVATPAPVVAQTPAAPATPPAKK